MKTTLFFALCRPPCAFYVFVTIKALHVLSTLDIQFTSCLVGRILRHVGFYLGRNTLKSLAAGLSAGVDCRCLCLAVGWCCIARDLLTPPCRSGLTAESHLLKLPASPSDEILFGEKTARGATSQTQLQRNESVSQLRGHFSTGLKHGNWDSRPSGALLKWSCCNKGDKMAVRNNWISW